MVVNEEIFIPTSDDDKPIIDDGGIVLDTDIDNKDDSNDDSKGNPPSPEPEVNEQPDQIDIDGVVYTMDANGNAVDSTGNVKYSKEDIEKLESESSDSGLDVESITKLTNITPVDTTGELVKYENTPEGIAKYVSDVYSIASNQAVEDYQNQLFTTYPILYDVLNHLSTNNTLEGFTKTVDYGSLTLDETNEIQLTNIIKEARALRGEDSNKIEKYITYLKDSNSVYSEAQEELKFLVAKDSEYKATQLKLVEEAEATERANAENYWGVKVDPQGKLIDLGKPDSIVGIIKSGKLKIGDDNYTIPDKIKVSDNGTIKYHSRTDFFNYLYNPIEVVIDNQKVKTTGYELDLYNKNAKKSIHDEVFEAFKHFVKFDTSQFIKDNVSRQNVKQVIKKINTKQNRNTQSRTTSSNSEIVIPRYE
jgi:hypothetical protein